MAQLDTDSIIDAATALGLAGHDELALRLLDADVDDAADRTRLALTAAQVTSISRFWDTSNKADAALARAAGALAAAEVPGGQWDLALLRLRARYAAVLFDGDGATTVATVAAQLRDEAATLIATAPDPQRRGWVEFYAGVIADNVTKVPVDAAAHYARAREAATATGDELLASYALRHLGGQALDDGDLATAQEMLWESTRLREKHGFVPGTIAQRQLLAEVAAARGDTATAIALARECARAAGARGWTNLEAQATELISRLDTVS